MELNQVMESAPGVTRRFVYYLESRGLIMPRKIWKQRIARRDYSENDARVIRDMWVYYQRGYAVSAAHEIATRATRTSALVRLPLPPKYWRQALKDLHREAHVFEATIVHGAEAALFIRLDTPTEAEVFHTLIPFLSKQKGVGSPHVLVAPQGMQRFPRKHVPRVPGESAVIAYVLLTVPGKDVNNVMDQLRELPEVYEAATVYGECDIVAKVAAPSQEAFDRVVMGRIHAIPEVVSTRTYIIVPSMHWSRESSGGHNGHSEARDRSEG